MFSLGLAEGISDTECSYWISRGGGYNSRQAACITPHQCNLDRSASEVSFFCGGSVVFLLSARFCLLSDNWSNVLVCEISVFLSAWNGLVSPPQCLHWTDFEMNRLICGKTYPVEFSL